MFPRKLDCFRNACLDIRLKHDTVWWVVHVHHQDTLFSGHAMNYIRDAPLLLEILLFSKHFQNMNGMTVREISRKPT